MLNRFIIAALMAWLPMSAQAALQVFACEPEWAALTQVLAGDKVAIYSATTAQQDVHQIQARPSLIAQMRKADLLVCTGAELEAGWLPLLLQRSANSKIQPGQAGYFLAAEQVTLLDVLEKVDRSMGDVHAAGNPHLHLDPYRMSAIAKQLSARLQALDPSNKAFYQQQGQQFQSRWESAIKQWEQQAVPLKGMAVVVHHKDWRYLLNWLGMRDVASLEPKPGVPPSASHLAVLKQQLTSQPAKLILYAHYQQSRPAEWLSAQAGIPAIELPYTVGADAKTNDLFELYQQTLNRLLAGLKK